jgi:hypothetical protein
MSASITGAGETPGFIGFRFKEAVYFTSNGTFTKADYPWLRAIRVRLVGGGGGGGGCATTSANQVAVVVPVGRLAITTVLMVAHHRLALWLVQTAAISALVPQQLLFPAFWEVRLHKPRLVGI